MRNKAIFLATTAVALVLMGTPAKADGLYVSAFGGLNFQPGSSGSQSSNVGPTTTVFSEDADTGFVIGGAVGTELQRWVQGLRAEVEVSYRRNDRSGSHQLFYGSMDDTPTEGRIDGNLSNFAVLANIWYEFDIGSKFRPHIGGGAGWVRSRLEAAASVTEPGSPTFFYGADIEEEESGVAFQLGAGLNHEVAPGVDVGIGYRYFNGPNFDPIFIGKNENLPVHFDNENHSVLVSLTISTN
jgi:OmpA-OmpF porin, OOP family